MVEESSEPAGPRRLEIALAAGLGIYAGTLALGLVGWAIGHLVLGAPGAFVKPVQQGLGYLAQGLGRLSLAPRWSLLSATLTAWAGSALVILPLLLRGPARGQLRRGERWAVIGAGVLAGLVLGAEIGYGLALVASPVLGFVGYRACRPRCVCGSCDWCLRTAPPDLSPQAEACWARVRVASGLSPLALALLGLVLHARWGYAEGLRLRDGVAVFAAALAIADTASVVLPALVVGLIVGLRRWPLRAVLAALLAGALTVSSFFVYLEAFRPARERGYDRLPVSELSAACRALPAWAASTGEPAPVRAKLTPGSPLARTLACLAPQLRAGTRVQLWVWPELVVLRLGTGLQHMEGLVVPLAPGLQPPALGEEPRPWNDSLNAYAVWGPRPAWSGARVWQYRILLAISSDPEEEALGPLLLGENPAAPSGS